MNVITIPCVTSITVYDGLHNFWLTINELMSLALGSSGPYVIDIMSPYNYSSLFVYVLFSLFYV